jgi:hypothetical protein
MSETADRVTPAAPAIERRLRLSGILLLVGLLIEGGTLFFLERPLGFLTFAGTGALLVIAGIALYLWAIASQGSTTPQQGA